MKPLETENLGGGCSNRIKTHLGVWIFSGRTFPYLEKTISGENLSGQFFCW